jgi:hypothetical protein
VSAFLFPSGSVNDRSVELRLPALGTLPNATNDFSLALSWPTGKLPVVCTRFGSLWKYFHKQRYGKARIIETW